MRETIQDVRKNKNSTVMTIYIYICVCVCAPAPGLGLPTSAVGTNLLTVIIGIAGCSRTVLKIVAPAIKLPIRHKRHKQSTANVTVLVPR